jgi:ferredoxin
MAIEFRESKTVGIEGTTSSCRIIYNSIEIEAGRFLTFPFLKTPELCNGCLICAEECPCCAIRINIQ